MTFLEVLKRIDECKEAVARGNGPSFFRQAGYNEDNIPIRRELESYDDVNFLTPADIFATDWEEW